jgi:hypothetical protein
MKKTITRDQLQRIIQEALAWSSRAAENVNPRAQHDEDWDAEAKWQARRAMQKGSRDLQDALSSLREAHHQVRQSFHSAGLAMAPEVAEAIRDVTRAIRALEKASLRGRREN